MSNESRLLAAPRKLKINSYDEEIEDKSTIIDFEEKPDGPSDVVNQQSKYMK